MKVIDLHCDTIMKIMESDHSKHLKSNDYSIDIEKLRMSKYLAQFFALFIDMKEVKDPYDYCMKMLHTFKVEIEANKNCIKHVQNFVELKECEKEHKIGAFLTIEEGGALKGDMNNLKTFYNEGVRLITLTWNYPNEIGYPNYQWKHKDKGLTTFGHELVEAMNNLGIIIDVSHLSDAGFYDVAKITTKPFTASHSNARAIKNHPRNLSDDMIKVLAEKGGVMGLNFCSVFLGNRPMSTIEDMVQHTFHIYKVGGSEVLCIGTDFDGIENEVEIKDSSEIMKLADAFKKVGFNENLIEKIFYKNAERFIKDTLS